MGDNGCCMQRHQRVCVWKCAHRTVPLLFVLLSLQSGSTALMIACHHNHVELCRYLLSLHASINIQDSLGWTALMFSCREGHGELVDLLLEDEWDTDVDLTTSQGINALMCAADAGHTRIVRALMEKEADVNACTNVRKRVQTRRRTFTRVPVLVASELLLIFACVCSFSLSYLSDRLVTLHCSKPVTAVTQPSCACCCQPVRR